MPPRVTWLIARGLRSADDIFTHGENRAQGMRDYFVSGGPCEVGRTAKVASSVANTQDDQIRQSISSERQDSIRRVSIFDERFGREVEVGILGNRFVKLMNCLGDGQFESPLVVVTAFVSTAFIAMRFVFIAPILVAAIAIA